MNKEFLNLVREIVKGYANVFMSCMNGVAEEDKVHVELQEVNYDLHKYRSVFFKVLRDIIEYRGNEPQILHSMPNQNLLADVDAEVTNSYISDSTYSMLKDKVKQNFFENTKIAKWIRKNKGVLYLACVMHFNRVAKEIGL